MKSWLRLACLVAGCLCAGPSPARTPADAGSRAALELSAGAFGVFDDSRPGQLGVKYRGRPLGGWLIAPGVGLTLARDGARFAYLDLGWSTRLGGHWSTTLTFGAGNFQDGRHVQLKGPLVFQSGVEIGRPLGATWRLGLAFRHLSNGGRSANNPGTEALTLQVSAALGRARGQASPVAPDAPSWRSSSRRINSPASAR